MLGLQGNLDAKSRCARDGTGNRNGGKQELPGELLSDLKFGGAP